ncbi:hypothetical protein FACS189413_13040 [Bacteroidia bacterium]|nr:hypothetical protein FACS189413_13040 [Bacteroidia bacterium]
MEVVTWSTEDGTTTAGSVTHGSNITTITAGSSAGNFKVKATAGGVTKECLVTVTVLNPGDYGTPNGTT